MLTKPIVHRLHCAIQVAEQANGIDTVMHKLYQLHLRVPARVSSRTQKQQPACFQRYRNFGAIQINGPAGLACCRISAAAGGNGRGTRCGKATTSPTPVALVAVPPLPPQLPAADCLRCSWDLSEAPSILSEARSNPSGALSILIAAGAGPGFLRQYGSAGRSGQDAHQGAAVRQNWGCSVRVR